MVPDLPPEVCVSAIACGGNHNLALTDKSEVYSWGYGDMLALGESQPIYSGWTRRSGGYRSCDYSITSEILAHLTLYLFAMLRVLSDAALHCMTLPDTV